MTDVVSICDSLGRAEMARRLDVSKGAITNGVANGSFPSRWYLVVKDMCAERGIDCPDGLFSFVGNAHAKTPIATAPQNAEAS